MGKWLCVVICAAVGTPAATPGPLCIPSYPCICRWRWQRIYPCVLRTETYKCAVVENIEGPANEWLFGIDPENATVFVVPVGTKINYSESLAIDRNYELWVNNGILQKWYNPAVELPDYVSGFTTVHDETLPGGGYCQFTRERFYVLVDVYNPATDSFYPSSIIHAVNEGTAPSVPTVSSSPCAATLDGKATTLNAYLFPENDGGSNYVMLRDVAQLLSGTKAQFEVSWEKDKGIILTTRQAYTPVGGELQSKGNGDKPYTANASTITVDGKAMELTAYTIEGNNYFKLRDLGAALGFGVDWDNASGTVVIKTTAD